MVAKEGRGRFGRGRRAFALPIHGAQVVGAAQVSAFAQVKTLGGGLGLNDAADKFEVCISEGASGLAVGGQLGRHSVWERHAPDNGTQGELGDFGLSVQTTQ